MGKKKKRTTTTKQNKIKDTKAPIVGPMFWNSENLLYHVHN